MSEDTTGDGTGNRGETRSRRQPGGHLSAVRPGDRVVHTTALGKEYVYRVAEVDPPWLTFETGQQVHRDRFEREDFAVVAPADPPVSDGVTVEAEDPAHPAEEAAGPTASAADGSDLRPPNAD